MKWKNLINKLLNKKKENFFLTWLRNYPAQKTLLAKEIRKNIRDIIRKYNPNLNRPVKNLPPFLKNRLRIIYNYSWNTGKIPYTALTYTYDIIYPKIKPQDITKNQIKDILTIITYGDEELDKLAIEQKELVERSSKNIEFIKNLYKKHYYPIIFDYIDIIGEGKNKKILVRLRNNKEKYYTIREKKRIKINLKEELNKVKIQKEDIETITEKAIKELKNFLNKNSQSLTKKFLNTLPNKYKTVGISNYVNYMKTLITAISKGIHYFNISLIRDFLEENSDYFKINKGITRIINKEIKESKTISKEKIEDIKKLIT